MVWSSLTKSLPRSIPITWSMMAARKPLHTFRQHARASRPDTMLSAGVAELVDALDLGSSDESCGGSSPSARTKRFQRLHGLIKGLFLADVLPQGSGSDEPTGAGGVGLARWID